MKKKMKILSRKIRKGQPLLLVATVGKKVGFIMLDKDLNQIEVVGRFRHCRFFKDGSFIITKLNDEGMMYYDNNANMIDVPPFNDYDIKREGIICLRDSNSGLWGHFYENGERVHNYELDESAVVVDGKIIVSIPSPDKIRSYNIIDVTTGELILSENFRRIKRHANGRFVVFNYDVCTMLDSNFNPLPVWFDNFKLSLAGPHRAYSDGKWFYVNDLGEDIFGKYFDKISVFKNNHGIVGDCIGDDDDDDSCILYSCIDENGNVSEESHSRIHTGGKSSSNNIYIAYDIDTDKQFHIHPNGKRLNDKSFNYVDSFKNGFAIAVDDQEMRFHVDLNGDPINDLKWSHIGNFTKKGFAWVELKKARNDKSRGTGRMGLINASGEVLIEPINNDVNIYKDYIQVEHISGNGLSYYKVVDHGKIELVESLEAVYE
jgi:hypothetical protein